LGCRFEVNTEFNLDWRLPVTVTTHENYTLLKFLPKLMLDLNAWASMEFHIWFINMRFIAHIKPYSFTPFDFDVKVDPVAPSRWCHGTTFYGNAL